MNQTQHHQQQQQHLSRVHQVRLQNVLPPEHAESPPVQSYETKYIYTGFRRIDTEAGIVSELKEDKEGRLWYGAYPWERGVLSRGYHTELVRVSIYSHSPRVWREELSPTEAYIFCEVTSSSTE